MATIYGVAVSPYVRKTMLVHAFKGIAYVMNTTMPGSDDAEFREISPLGKIPGYRNYDGVGFSDSSVITAYLERVRPEIPLYPADNNDFARALWLEEYADTKMMEVSAALYFQQVIGPKFFDHSPDQERIDQLQKNLIPAELDYVESQAGPGWFVGDAMTIADIAIGTNLVNLHHAGFELDPQRWPKVAAFAQRFLATPQVQMQLIVEQKDFEQAGGQS